MMKYSLVTTAPHYHQKIVQKEEVSIPNEKPHGHGGNNLFCGGGNDRSFFFLFLKYYDFLLNYYFSSRNL